jgi:hypothetical protein
MGRVLRMTCCISEDRGLCTVEMEEMLVSTGMSVVVRLCRRRVLGDVGKASR